VLQRLTAALNKIQAYGLMAIVCLTDLYTSGYSVMGDDGYYQRQPSGYTILDDSWFAGGYAVNYKPMVQTLVRAAPFGA
jgi:hypothetical protein